MKTRSILLVLALVLISFSSCSKIKDALTIKVPVEFTNDMQVRDSTSGLKSSLSYSFYAQTSFNPSTDATVIKYKSKIKSFTATGVSFTPTGLPGDVSVQYAYIAIGVGGTSIEDIKIYWQLPAFTLKNGVKVDLPAPTMGTFADISTYLEGDQQIELFWWGGQDTRVLPYVFTTTFTADVVAFLLK